MSVIINIDKIIIIIIIIIKYDIFWGRRYLSDMTSNFRTVAMMTRRHVCGWLLTEWGSAYRRI
jgi:hypothetical protein